MPPGDFPLSFNRVSELQPAETEKGLLYGGSGVGKTALFGTLSRALILDTGSGLETLKSPWFKGKNPGKDPLTVSIKEKIDAYGEVNEANAYDLTCDAIDYAIAHFSDDFDDVVVDDMTAFQRYAMYKSSEFMVETGMVKIKMPKPKNATDRVEAFEKVITEVQEWQGQMNLVMKFLVGSMTICEKAKKNFWCGAHEKFIYKLPKREDGKTMIGEQPEVIMVYPAFTGKQYPDAVQGLFDDVWHLEVDGENRKLRIKEGDTARYGKVIAKTRHDGVFTDRKGESVDFLLNPNLSNVLAQIRAGQSKPTQSK